MLFVKPSINPETDEPHRIRRPERNFTHLPDEGAEVPNNRFWRKHLADGSVEIVQQAAATKPKKGTS